MSCAPLVVWCLFATLLVVTEAQQAASWSWVEVARGQYCTYAYYIGSEIPMTAEACGTLAAADSRCNPNLIFIPHPICGTNCYCAPAWMDCSVRGSSSDYSIFERQQQSPTPAPTPTAPSWIEVARGQYCANDYYIGSQTPITAEACLEMAAANPGCNPDFIFIPYPICGTNCYCAQAGDDCSARYASSLYAIFQRQSPTPAQTAPTPVPTEVPTAPTTAEAAF